MPRIRTLKPQFWTSEQVMDLSRDARLLFIGLWSFADDAGRFTWSARTIRARVLPGDDDITTADVARWLEDIGGMGLIRSYTVDGVRYGEITGWAHQRIDRPQPSKLPSPPEIREESGVRRIVDEYSTNDRRALATDRKGEESKGKGEERRVPVEPAPAPSLTWKKVGAMFARRYERATTRPVALHLHQRAFEAVLLESRGDPDAVERSLQNFWNDPWAIANRWPPATWARQFGRHLEGLSGSPADQEAARKQRDAEEGKRRVAAMEAEWARTQAEHDAQMQRENAELLANPEKMKAMLRTFGEPQFTAGRTTSAGG